MPLLFLIETSSINCSIAICDENKILAFEEKQEINIHASAITLFIEEVLKKANKTLKDIDAIAVGKGPGSYTGLRIGVSTAKGLCYALEKPLIACNSLKTLFEQAKTIHQDTSLIYCPLLDARRMEVYTCMYNFDGNEIKNISATIIEEHTFSEELSNYKILFFGDGAEKTKLLYSANKNAMYIDGLYPSAKFMHHEALECYNKNRFEDVAYFEPYYLKEFFFNKK